VEEGSLEAFAAAADRKIVHDLQFTRLMGLPDSRSSAYLSKLNNENNRQEAAAGRSGRGSKISGGGGFQRITHLFGLFSQSPGVFLGCPENPRACPKHAPSTPPLSALAAYLRLRGRGGGGGSGASTRDSKAKSHSKGRNGAIFIGSGGGAGGGGGGGGSSSAVATNGWRPAAFHQITTPLYMRFLAFVVTDQAFACAAASRRTDEALLERRRSKSTISMGSTEGVGSSPRDEESGGDGREGGGGGRRIGGSGGGVGGGGGGEIAFGVLGADPSSNILAGLHAVTLRGGSDGSGGTRRSFERGVRLLVELLRERPNADWFCVLPLLRSATTTTATIEKVSASSSSSSSSSSTTTWLSKAYVNPVGVAAATQRFCERGAAEREAGTGVAPSLPWWCASSSSSTTTSMASADAPLLAVKSRDGFHHDGFVASRGLALRAREFLHGDKKSAASSLSSSSSEDAFLLSAAAMVDENPMLIVAAPTDLLPAPAKAPPLQQQQQPVCAVAFSTKVDDLKHMRWGARESARALANAVLGSWL
jgi:hypothetical protein